MDFNFRKIFGWVLLIIGLGIILWSIFTSFNIFTAKIEAPEIFEVSETQKVLITEKEESQDIQIMMEELISKQFKNILPSGSIPILLNLIAWSIMASILIFGGTQISGLGIKLIK